jgi:hypothetical protein
MTHYIFWTLNPKIYCEFLNKYKESPYDMGFRMSKNKFEKIDSFDKLLSYFLDELKGIYKMKVNPKVIENICIELKKLIL